MHRIKFTSFAPHHSNRYHQNIVKTIIQKESFIQKGPNIDKNVFLGDAFLQRCLARLIHESGYHENVITDLIRFGKRISSEINDIGWKCEIQPPYLQNFTDAWGKQNHNRLITCEAWKSQKRIAAEEGLVAIPYQNKNKFSRIHQTAKLYMYSPVSGLYWCPLAMTDGAAQAISRMKNKSAEIEDAFQHLISNDPNEFWTSGQWMTESRGGSDVASSTETFATGPMSDGTYRLHGYKWFASAADSDIALALARTFDKNQVPIEGTNGISMFYIKNQNNSENNDIGIHILKLKNKMGTRQLPTAELSMTNTKGILMSQEGRGIASIASMFTVSRMHNIIASVGIQRRMLNLARDYATKRAAFGKYLFQHPLHIATLSKMETDVRGCTILMLDLARQLGEEEERCISNDDKLLLRLMMPIAKAFTAKMAVSNISEGIECFGGQGYIEDTGIPCMLRDSQVLPIWEGTTNIMALDMQRALDKTKNKSLEVFYRRVMEVSKKGVDHSDESIKASSRIISDSTEVFMKYFSKEKSFLNDELVEQKLHDNLEKQIELRDEMFLIGNLYIGALLLEHVLFFNGDNKIDVLTLSNWITQRDIVSTKITNHAKRIDQQTLNDLQNILFEGHHQSK